MEHPKITYHPNQESKRGLPTYASSTKKNYSANEPLSEGEDERAVGGIESEYRNAALNRKSKKGTLVSKIIKKLKK